MSGRSFALPVHVAPRIRRRSDSTRKVCKLIKYMPSALTKSGTSHASEATSCGVASEKKSSGNGITDSTTRVLRTSPTFQVILPKVPRPAQVLRVNATARADLVCEGGGVRGGMVAALQAAREPLSRLDELAQNIDYSKFRRPDRAN